MGKLGVLLVGPGWVAGEHIKSYCLNPNTEVRAIAGMIPEDEGRTKGYMEEYNFQCDYTNDYEKALERDDIDIVSVCTINFLHYEQGLAAIQAGKHTFVEKPLAFTMEQINALKEATLKYKVKTQVGHVARYYPAVRGLKAFIDQGGIGDIFYGECDYWHEVIGAWKVKPETGGSALLMGGCHAIDMLRWMVGEDHEVTEVTAYANQATWREDFEYDPTIALICKFDNGTVGKVATSLECNMPYVFHIQMCGTKGTIRNNGIYSEMFPQSTDFMSIPSVYPDDWNVSHHPFPDEVDDYVSCIVEDREPELSFPRAAKTYEVLFAAELSARENTIVKLPLT